MKKVTVKHFRQISEYILLENNKDVFLYFLHVEKGLKEYLKKIIKSKVPVNRWDHCCSKGQGESIFTLSVNLSYINCINPIYLMDNVLQTKMKNFYENIEKYGNVIVNDNGGYCHLIEDMEITSEESFSFEIEDLLTYVVKPNTQYINLENDPMLENYTKEYLGNIDPNFSYILNLRKFSIDNLVKVFNEFNDNDGHTVYLYTTGMDIPQMYDYSNALIKSNLNNIIFHFNAGINDDILGVIEYLKNQNVQVEYQNI